MKKLLIAFALPLLFLGLPHAAFAQACPSGNDGDCPGDMVCDTNQTPYTCKASDEATTGAGNLTTGQACTSDGQCSGNLACIHGQCQIDPSLEDTGTAAPGGACNPQNNNNDCPGGQTCNATSATAGTCVGATSGNTNVNAGNTNGSTGFVPLAPIPGLDDNQSSVSASSLATFFNNLYKYLIGLAAILAVIQIIRGGLEYATQDSVSKKDDGKHHIQGAILGLVLILLPALILGIINPSILNLSVNLPPLKTPTGTAQPLTNGGGSAGPTTTDPATGCTAGGTAIKTANCPSSQAAQNWISTVCGADSNALTGAIKACQSLDGTNGCLDKTYTAYCEESMNFLFYVVESRSLLTLGEYQPSGAAQVTPDDAAKYTSFKNDCQASGGSPSQLPTVGGAFTALFSSAPNCPADVTHPGGTIVVCATVSITCKPPS